MHPADIQKEHARLSQLYRDMHEEELERVAAEAYDLTEIAREALSFEISSRGLKIPFNLTPPSEEALEPLMRRADEALYKAKKNGRDSVRLSYERPETLVVPEPSKAG